MLEEIFEHFRQTRIITRFLADHAILHLIIMNNAIHRIFSRYPFCSESEYHYYRISTGLPNKWFHLSHVNLQTRLKKKYTDIYNDIMSFPYPIITSMLVDIPFLVNHYPFRPELKKLTFFMVEAVLPSLIGKLDNLQELVLYCQFFFPSHPFIEINDYEFCRYEKVDPCKEESWFTLT